MKKILIITLIFAFSKAFSQVNSQASLKLQRALDIINLFYVDSVKTDKLVEAAIIEMLKTLDPHSSYISSDEVREVNEPLEGNFEGIGIQFNIYNDTILVVNPIPGGPSEKLGIRAGDRIIKIDGQNVAGVGIKNNEVFKKLRGKKGTQITVSILRRNEKELIDFTITRDKIPIYSLDASYMVDKEIGYIKLNRFSATTIEEFRKSITELKLKGMKDLIVDLAGNGGGYLNASVDLADEFLDNNKKIVYTQGLTSPRTDYKATEKGEWHTGRLVIIVDEGSASASEIVSGAVQDWDRGVIVGRKTFGKGLVQRPFNLNDGSLIRLTVAKYYTPSGRLIQKPYEKGFVEYSNEIINRYNNGELTNADSIHFPESLKYQTLISKRTVYGGGGIMPDIFVPLDTNEYTKFYRSLYQKNLIYRFVLDYMDTQRENLKKEYPNFLSFKANFKVNSTMIDSICSKARKEKIDFTEEEKIKSEHQISVLVKALLARDLWDTSQYFEIINPTRDEYNKAIEILKDKKLYNRKLGKL